MTGDYYVGKLNNVFVSSSTYPSVNLSLLLKDDPEQKSFQLPSLYRRSLLKIPNIIYERKKLVNSYFKSGIHERSNKIDDVHLMTMASKPIDVEVDFKKQLSSSNLIYDKQNIDIPIPKYNPLNSFKLTSTTPLIKPVEKIYYDKDITTIDAYSNLYNKVNIYRLIDMFSVGLFGRKLNKKLVPTKWSITANDDIASNNFIEELRDYRHIKSYELYYSNYLGNHYVTLLFPREWSYELFEFGVDGVITSPIEIDNKLELVSKFQGIKSSYDKTKQLSSTKIDSKYYLDNYTTDYESYYGRKNYAVNCVGGYYSVRYSVAKFLYDRKKQASALTLRFVDKTYNTPMGVWVCREASNFSMAKSLGFFNNFDQAFKKLIEFSNQLGIVNLNKILKKSLLLNFHKFQKRIIDY